MLYKVPQHLKKNGSYQERRKLLKRLGIFVDPFTFRLNTAWPTYWPLAYTPIPMRQNKKILIDQSSVIYIYAMLSIPFFDLIFATFFIIKKTKSNERASIPVQFYQLKCSDFSNENWMTWKCKQIVSFAGYRIDMFFYVQSTPSM